MRTLRRSPGLSQRSLASAAPGAVSAAEASDDEWADSTDDDGGWGDDEDGEDGFGFEEETNPLPPPIVAPTRPWSLVSVFQTREGFWLERLNTDPLADFAWFRSQI